MLLLRLFAAKDRGVYVVCSLIGFLIFLGLRPAFWAGYAAALVTYHLFLAYRIVAVESNQDQSRSHGLTATIAAHIGLVLALVAVRFAAVELILNFVGSQPEMLHSSAIRMGARAVGLVTVVLVYGLVSLECKLLFSGKQHAGTDQAREMESVFVEMSAKLRRKDEPLVAATGADHGEWVQYCARRNAKYYNPGLSPKDDFEQWLRARGKTQSIVSQSEGWAAD